MNFKNKLLILAGCLIPTLGLAEEKLYSVSGEYASGGWASSVSIHRIKPWKGRVLMTGKLSALVAKVENPTNDKKQIHYGTVDASLGLRYGKKVFAFGEFGIDVGELLAYWEFADSVDGIVDPDRHVALGIGYKAPDVSLGVFNKYRYVSGYLAGEQEYWMLGVELSFKY